MAYFKRPFILLLVSAIGLGGLTLATSAMAAQKPQELGVTQHVLKTESGDSYFTLHHIINEHGEREVVVEHDEIRRFRPDTHLVVLYGRDLDRDGRYDGWFVMGRGVEQAIDRVARDGDGWEVISEILSSHPKMLKNRWLVSVLADFLANFSFRGATDKEFFASMDRAHIDLRDMEIRTDRLAKIKKGNPLVSEYYSMISAEWNLLGEKVEKKEKTRWAWAAADVASYFAGPLIWSRLQPVFDWLGVRVAQSEVANWTIHLYEQYISTLVSGIKAAVIRVTLKNPLALNVRKAVRATINPVGMVQLAFGERIDIAIRAMEARSALSKFMALSLKASYRAGKTGMSQWRYIGQTTAVQLVAETLSRSEALYDRNPIIMSRKISSDRDLMQDLAYMTNETFLMAGVSGSDSNPRRRMAICSVLAMTDSVTMNYAVKGNVDLGRNVIDTQWESVVGNLQTQIDVTALKTFEGIAMAQKYPGFKLVGYAVALVDQLAGYYVYAEATQKYANHKKAAETAPQVRWIPILAPAS